MKQRVEFWEHGRAYTKCRKCNHRTNFVCDGEDNGCEDCNGRMYVEVLWPCLYASCGVGFDNEKECNDHMSANHGAFRLSGKALLSQ